MAAQIQHNPKTVSVFGDSYSSHHFDKPNGVAYSPLSSIAAGAAGDFIVLPDRSYGGTTAHDAVYNTGPWLSPLQMGGTFDFCAPYDVAKYQVFRYGVNEAVQKDGGGNYIYSLPGFEFNLNSLITSSISAGRKPILCTPPTIPVQGLMTVASASRLTDVIQRTKSVAASRNVPLVDLSGWVFQASDMLDAYHPNAQVMHALNKELGVRLKAILSAGY